MGRKRWCVISISFILAFLILFGGITVIVDPYFHYHKPINNFAGDRERYINNGILKHFDYDGIVAGSSFAENFKTGEFDELFNTHSVKATAAGAGVFEVSRTLRTAIKANPNIKIILTSIPYEYLIQDKDNVSYSADLYPMYLYDNNPFNDVKYVFNEAVFRQSLETIKNTISGKEMTSFDDYAYWSDDYKYGKEAVFSLYKRPERKTRAQTMTAEETKILRDNVTQNLTSIAAENPNIEFYYFFPPSSIVKWDEERQNDFLGVQFQSERQAIEMMLEYDNIHLFSFFDDFDLITDLDRYKDPIHYDGAVNSYILRAIAAGEHELTKDNYLDYLSSVREFYSNYDYDALFVGYEVPEGNGE